MPDISTIPWEMIILHPVGMALLYSTVIFGIFIFIIWTKTPVFTMLIASFLKRMIIINPKENRFIDFKIAKLRGSLAHIKNQGYYILDPNDVYIERKTKIPMVVSYGNYGKSLDLTMAGVAEKLKAMGIKNFKELMILSQQLKKEKKTMDFKLLGQTVNIADAVNYFGKNERSDLTEAEIQWRQSAVMMSKVNPLGSWLKYLIIIGVFLILVAVAYQMIIQGAPQQVIEASRVVTANTGTALT